MPIYTFENIKTGKEKKLNITEANSLIKKANWKITSKVETENLFEWSIIQEKINSSIILSAYIKGQKSKDENDYLSLYEN